MAQLVRVGDRAHTLDPAVGDVEDRDAEQLALGVEEERARLAVDLLAARREATKAGEGAQAPDQQARHLRAAVDGTWGCGYFAAAIAAEDDVVGEQLLQSVEVALLDGGEEAVRELLAPLARGLEARPPLLNVAAGSADELAGVLLARADDLRDPVLGLVERLVQ
jgi:hypothetical protein